MEEGISEKKKMVKCSCSSLLSLVSLGKYKQGLHLNGGLFYSSAIGGVITIGLMLLIATYSILTI